MVNVWRTSAIAFVTACVCTLVTVLVMNRDRDRGDSQSEFPGRATVLFGEKWLQIFEEFETFHRKYNRKYQSTEDALKRFATFAQNIKKIEELKRNEKGTARYELNGSADSFKEDTFIYPTNRNSTTSSGSEKIEGRRYVKDDSKTVPESKDWRKEGKVSPVKNQGLCNSCWAFATAACAESMYAIRNNSTAGNYSVQQLVDCDLNSQGCAWGYPARAIEYLIRSGGIVEWESYPYSEKNGDCRFSKDKVVTGVMEKITFAPGDEESIKSFIGTTGPVALCLNADLLDFYAGGVFNQASCSEESTHCVLIVGYGNDPVAGDYWIVKNSWGTGWGEEGYFRMTRGVNKCGISNWVFSLQISSA